MKENTKNQKKHIQKLALCSVFIALATVLSLIKIINMPLGGSVTLVSMLPIVMLPIMLGLKWGFISAFVYSVIQLILGIADGLLGWGLTPIMLIGTIFLDYIAAFSVLGIAGIASKKGTNGALLGIIIAFILRFLCHFASGCIIFVELDQFQIFGNAFVNRPVLYSIAYNGFYMLPELVFTLIIAVILLNIPQIKRLTNSPS